MEGRDSEQKARVRDAIRGAAGPVESAEGEIRGGGCGEARVSQRRLRLFIALPWKLEKITQSLVGSDTRGTGRGGPPLTPLFPIHLLESHNGSSGPSRVEGWSSGGLQKGRKWFGGGRGLGAGGVTRKTLGCNAKQCKGEREAKKGGGEVAGRDSAGQEWIQERLCLLWLNEWCCSWQALTDYTGKGQAGGCSHCYFLGGNGLAAPLHSE